MSCCVTRAWFRPPVTTTSALLILQTATNLRGHADNGALDLSYCIVALRTYVTLPMHDILIPQASQRSQFPVTTTPMCVSCAELSHEGQTFAAFHICRLTVLVTHAVPRTTDIGSASVHTLQVAMELPSYGLRHYEWYTDQNWESQDLPLSFLVSLSRGLWMWVWGKGTETSQRRKETMV